MAKRQTQFEIFLEEEGRDLEGQFGIHERDSTHRLEPHLELLWLHNLGNDLQTVIPNPDMHLLLVHMIGQKKRPGLKLESQCKDGGKKIEKNFFLILHFNFF